ncbi:hypothetical protein T4B_3402 [Trichinella pseudospiralis]|uniref:Uncharacterized protein n=1 Tax=Trichinella pseudospiralis TaxID=6337 RepID=A0A0V0XJW5_TRIPS|nr:hypothetical protein T4E_6411 [Trichinella pseudospiralis]KRZ10107.1 hypothetical protein T4B_3402 [Trichinella pseudospiralis]
MESRTKGYFYCRLGVWISLAGSTSTPSSCYHCGGQLLATHQNEISLTVRLSRSTQSHRSAIA